MSPDWRFTAFWVIWGAVGLAGELVALHINGARDSLSANIWDVLRVSPTIWWLGLLIAIAVGLHLFGRTMP